MAGSIKPPLMANITNSNPVSDIWARWFSLVSLSLSTSAPLTSTEFGVVGQTAVDDLGNFYWCYSPSKWARIGPGGYSNTF